MECQDWGEIELVLLIVFHLRQIVVAPFDHHMASGTGAGAPTGMFNVKAEVFGEVEQAQRFAMSTVGHGFRGELVGGSVVQKRDFRHDFAKGPV